MEELPAPCATRILPCSTWHIPASAQGWLSPRPEGMPEDESSATASALASCRICEPSCSPGQLDEASATAVTQSTKSVSAPGDSSAPCVFPVCSDRTDNRGETRAAESRTDTKVYSTQSGTAPIKQQRLYCHSPRAQSPCQPLPASAHTGTPPGPFPGHSADLRAWGAARNAREALAVSRSPAASGARRSAGAAAAAARPQRPAESGHRQGNAPLPRPPAPPQLLLTQVTASRTE